jgi:hypothetical protein
MEDFWENPFEGLGTMGESFILTPSDSMIPMEMLKLLRDNLNMIVAVDESTNTKLHKISFYMKQPYNPFKDNDGEGGTPREPVKPQPVTPIDNEWEA